ncbi:hypothetical protein [Gloeobacter violaceus]|nr:hypothetical protein [Gloeobacter violaceus]
MPRATNAALAAVLACALSQTAAVPQTSNNFQVKTSGPTATHWQFKSTPYTKGTPTGMPPLTPTAQTLTGMPIGTITQFQEEATANVPLGMYEY